MSVCLLLFWFAFSPCESKRIRLRTHHHHKHHQINIKWTYRLQLFYATFPSGFSCCVFFLPRATRDTTVPEEGTRPTRTVPASLPPSPSQLLRGLFVVIWHIVKRRCLSTITRVLCRATASSWNLHIILINRMKMSENFHLGQLPARTDKMLSPQLIIVACPHPKLPARISEGKKL